jgi:hypothetical protein
LPAGAQVEKNALESEYVFPSALDPQKVTRAKANASRQNLAAAVDRLIAFEPERTGQSGPPQRKEVARFSESQHRAV